MDQALQSILANFLQLLWTESLEFAKEADMRSRIIGVSASMKSFDFFFGVSLEELLLNHSDNLSKTLQSNYIGSSRTKDS